MCVVICEERHRAFSNAVVVVVVAAVIVVVVVVLHYDRLLLFQLLPAPKLLYKPNEFTRISRTLFYQFNMRNFFVIKKNECDFPFTRNQCVAFSAPLTHSN